MENVQNYVSDKIRDSNNVVIDPSTKEYQNFIIDNLKAIIRKLFRLTFDTNGQLRVITGTITTVTTITTANTSFGDIGKPATGIIMSRQLTLNNRRNLG